MLDQEVIVFSDDDSWVGVFLTQTLESMGQRYAIFPTSTSVRHSWARIKDAKKIVLTWENTYRAGGALVEEILDIQPDYPVSDKIISLSKAPLREDIVYFSELGLKQLIRLRQKEADLFQAGSELSHFIQKSLVKPPDFYRQFLIDIQEAVGNKTKLNLLKQRLEKFGESLKQQNARFLDAKACLFEAYGEKEQAIDYWNQAIEENPHFFGSYKNLIRFYRQEEQYEEAIKYLKWLQKLNPNLISRQCEFGEIYMASGDIQKSETSFKKALDADPYSNRAIDGIANIFFERGELNEARSLLDRATVSLNFARKLNLKGIELVNSAQYKEALDLYTKAQYVLPQREKGARLFFNMALCCFKWGRFEDAKAFVALCLAKEPEFKKAEKLFKMIQKQQHVAA